MVGGRYKTSIEAAREIITKLDSKITETSIGNPFFGDPDVIAFPLSKESFRNINTDHFEGSRKIAFVDGGNLEIIGAPNFSVQLNRVYACVWKNNQRQSILHVPRIEFYSAISSTIQDDKIIYETIIAPSDPRHSLLLPDQQDLSFDSFDRTITNGMQRADIQKVASIARNFAEWKFASIVAEALERDDILVMDGSLQTQFRNEWKYFRALEDVTKNCGVILTSLSKTSTLFTSTGLSLLGAVNQLSKESNVFGEWYHPIFDSHKHRIFGLVVKLKSISEWVFRLDVERDQFLAMGNEELDEVLGVFCQNASDPTFPGYPYGSIDADLFSKVTESELPYYRALLLAQICDLNRLDKFRYHIRASDAHDILNSMTVG